MREYFAEYEHQGSRWSVSIWADSWEDAEARLRKLAFAKIDGEVFVSVPVAPTGLHRIWQRITGK